MKKVIITENQAESLVSKILDEQVPALRATEYSINDGRYRMAVIADFDYYKQTYKGFEIDDIDKIKLEISFLIDIDHESFGIKGIYIHDIQGPKEVKTLVHYYTSDVNSEDFEDSVKEPIVIPIDWKRIKIEKYSNIKYIGIEKNITIDLVSSPDGGLKFKSVEVTVNELRPEE